VTLRKQISGAENSRKASRQDAQAAAEIRRLKRDVAPLVKLLRHSGE
jgi:hypothetical protein